MLIDFASPVLLRMYCKSPPDIFLAVYLPFPFHVLDLSCTMDS